MLVLLWLHMARAHTHRLVAVPRRTPINGAACLFELLLLLLLFKWHSAHSSLHVAAALAPCWARLAALAWMLESIHDVQSYDSQPLLDRSWCCSCSW